MTKPKTKRFPSVRTNDEQVERIVKAAELLESPASEWIRKTIDKELDRLARRFPELARKAA